MKKERGRKWLYQESNLSLLGTVKLSHSNPPGIRTSTCPQRAVLTTILYNPLLKANQSNSLELIARKGKIPRKEKGKGKGRQGKRMDWLAVSGIEPESARYCPSSPKLEFLTTRNSNPRSTTSRTDHYTIQPRLDVIGWLKWRGHSLVCILRVGQ